MSTLLAFLNSIKNRNLNCLYLRCCWAFLLEVNFWCLPQMIKSKVGSIKSGWRSVFMIFTAAADDDLESIVESAFENVEQGKNHTSSSSSCNSSCCYILILFFLLETSVYLTPSIFAVILEHFDQVVGDCFMDCVNCLIRFANNKSSHRISLKAIALLRICEDRLAEVCYLVCGFVEHINMF